MAFRYSPKIVTDGLVLALDAGSENSYPGSGTTWTDLSGNGNNGTLNVEGIGTVSASLDTMAFDGSSSDIITLTDSSFDTVFSGSSSWSIQFVASFIGSNSYYPLFSKGSSRNNLGPGFTVHGYDGRIEGGDGSSGYDVYSFFGSDLRNTGFNLLTITYDGTNIRGYKNTTLKKTYEWTSGIGDTSAYDVKIGDFWGPTFEGYIDIVRFYNKTMSQTEITQNFNAQRNRFGI